MPIPAFTDDGFLPEGIHDCTLAEVRERFGQFQRTDWRPQLFHRLASFVADAQKTGFVVAIIVDGSFVTSIDAPNDVDVILVSSADHDFDAELRPFEYNVVSRPQVRRLHGIDMLVAREGHDDLTRSLRLFSRTRVSKQLLKGVLRISL